MSKEKLKYLSQITIDNLYANVEDNLERYVAGDFKDIAQQGGWDIELSLEVDLAPLKNLVMEKNAAAEIANTLLVWNTLHELLPSLACEDRIWTRLTHLECLEYSRYRWLSGQPEEKQTDVIKTHFFANTQTRYRDDNAISRLWWNAYIAKLAAPRQQEQAIRVILKTADIRNNFIERTRTVSRPKLAAGIVRAMLGNPVVTEKESNFRAFMRTLNMLGGGKVFECWSDQKIDEFVWNCVQRAEII